MGMTVSGNLGEQSEAQMRKAFKKGLGGTMPPNPLTKMRKPRLASGKTDFLGSTKGPYTVGGCVGGLADKKDYQGVKAGK